MSEHKTKLEWKRTTPDFSYETYDRTHGIQFEGGQVVSASSAPEFLGTASRVNPEELLAGALSSCHMLTFLAIAAKSRIVVDKYEDETVALLEKNAAGILAITRVFIRPRVTFAEGQTVTPEKLAHLHKKSHDNCFIANSVKCEVIVESQN